MDHRVFRIDIRLGKELNGETGVPKQTYGGGMVRVSTQSVFRTIGTSDIKRESYKEATIDEEEY